MRRGRPPQHIVTLRVRVRDCVLAGGSVRFDPATIRLSRWIIFGIPGLRNSLGCGKPRGISMASGTTCAGEGNSLSEYSRVLQINRSKAEDPFRGSPYGVLAGGLGRRDSLSIFVTSIFVVPGVYNFIGLVGMIAVGLIGCIHSIPESPRVVINIHLFLPLYILLPITTTLTTITQELLNVRNYTAIF